MHAIQSAVLCPWRAALYIRLSRDDGDKLESNSVTNQREILREHLKLHPDIAIHDTYIDDGWSGTNFDRPGFRRMMEDIYAGVVNCVIVKDLSRFCRNASEGGQYLDNVFVGQTNANRMLTVHNVTPEKHVLRVEYSGRCVAKAISVNSDNLAFMQDILSVEQSIKREPQMAKVKPESETAKNYRIGDIVTVNGVKGIVFQIFPVVKVVSVSEITAQWSTENFITGATNVDGGSVNMTKIKAIYGWESKYPAFKWCADLGDGWYLPSYNEVKAIYNQKNVLNSTVLADGLLKFSAGYYWSSTECNDGRAYLANFSSGIVDCYYKFYNFKQVRAICVL